MNILYFHIFIETNLNQVQSPTLLGLERLLYFSDFISDSILFNKFMIMTIII